MNNDGLRETSMAYEEELRAMLSRTNRPAVIGLECFQMVNLYGDGGVNAVSASVRLMVTRPDEFRALYIGTTMRHISA